MFKIRKAFRDIANRLNSIFNWVTEEYDSNGWHVVKYRNGWCKLYYRYKFTTTDSGWTAWGSIYQKAAPVINYPVTFDSVPIQSTELHTRYNSGWLNIGDNTISGTGKHYLTRPAAGASFDGWIIYRVYGKLGGVINNIKNWRWSYA